jgi:hypothetical protein
VSDAGEGDPSLYSGSAEYYARGRVAELRLDGAGRLLDVGCEPGSLTLPPAGAFTVRLREITVDLWSPVTTGC